MTLLLDSQVLLWWFAGSTRLGSRAHAAIDGAGSLVAVSAATVWEIAIKQAAGRLVAPGDLGGAVAATGFRPLAITVEHALAAAALPPHHGDPFDRMLVAQARIEGLRLVTADQRISRYDVSILPADG